MTAMFTYEEGSILLRLLIAHVITDFFLQPDSWVENKKKNQWKSKYLLPHALLAGVLSAIFLWDVHYWLVALVIFLTHYIIDGIKLQLDANLAKQSSQINGLSRKKLRNFIFDQTAHLLVILGVWLYIIQGTSKLNISKVLFDYHVLLYLAGYLVILKPTGYLIHMFTNRWADSLDLNDSLKDVGKWIGMMERIIILTLVILNQFAAIGFLVTAKSLLRLIDKPDVPSAVNSSQNFSARKHTEYVLVGTFLSFSVALAIGMLIKLFLKF